MATLTITLPKALKELIEDQAACGDQAINEYVVGALCLGIRQENEQALKGFQERIRDPRYRARIEELLLEGLNSPVSEMTAKDWDEIRKEGMGLIAEKKRAKGRHSKSRSPARSR